MIQWRKGNLRGGSWRRSQCVRWSSWEGVCVAFEVRVLILLLKLSLSQIMMFSLPR